MSLLQRCLGFKNPTDINEFAGVWERVGDDFEGCIIKIEQETNEWIGKIIVSTPDMLEAGWAIGDKKWRHIERDPGGDWQLMDLRKQYDTAQKKVLSVDYAHYWISLSGSRKLRLHQSKVPLFPAQVWKKIN